MEFSRLTPIENVVRMIFPLTMMYEGELLPAAFRLREQKDGPEQFLSVFRQYAETFQADIRDFDKSRNLPCCLINVGEVEATNLVVAENRVVFTVKAAPTSVYTSHAGIFVSIAGLPIEGEGYQAFTALNIGEESRFVMSAVRRRLVDIAKKRMTTVMQLLIAD